MTDDNSNSEFTPGANMGATSQSNSYSEQAYRWLLRNGLYVEVAISIVAVATGAIALPFLAFGSLAAIGGEGSILAVGAAISLACIVILISLAVLLLSHGYLEVSHRGTPFTGGGSTHTLAYDGIRTIETVAAGTFIGGLVTALGFVLSVGEIPTALSVVVTAAAVGLPVTLLVHAVGRFVSFVLDVG
jgi:hypothetical protein